MGQKLPPAARGSEAAPQEAKEGFLQRGTRSLVLGCTVTNSGQIQPRCVTSGGSPKLFPLITMQEFTATGLLCAGVYRKGPPWLQATAKQTNRRGSLGVSFPALRSDQRLFT